MNYNSLLFNFKNKKITMGNKTSLKSKKDSPLNDQFSGDSLFKTSDETYVLTNSLLNCD